MSSISPQPKESILIAFARKGTIYRAFLCSFLYFSQLVLSHDYEGLPVIDEELYHKEKILFPFSLAVYLLIASSPTDLKTQQVNTF